MRRYIFSSPLGNTPDGAFDVIVVGGGMAGLFAALELDGKYSVALVAKGDIESGSSWLAQGGICCVYDSDDSFALHTEDTLAAGAGHCDRIAVETMVSEGPENIKRLISYGVPFDKNPDGSLRVTREGGHCRRRILHCGGDATGREITRALGKRVSEKSNITVFWDHTLVDILTSQNGVTGVVINDGQRDLVLKTGDVVVATGGAGQLYRYSTTPSGNTGEGIAACLRAGARSRDMEFVQFHPTAFAIHGENERVFLISEAVRGEGAVLKNKYGEAFMSRKGAHPQSDLAPRDIVTRAVLAEMKATGEEHVYLDATHMPDGFFEKRFPTITAKCRECGIEPSRDMIPVHPTQHYLMGGIYTDLDAKTNIKGLYVCGEAACTGVHGANRLASNSTLECIVFAKRASDSINRNKHTPDEINTKYDIPGCPCPDISEAEADMRALRLLMTEKVGAERTYSGLFEASEKISQLFSKYENCRLETPFHYTLYSALQTATDIVGSALCRKQSLGAHHVVSE